MANLKQILQNNNNNIAYVINEQNKNIKNYIDNKDAVLQNDIDAINNKQTGILAQAKQDADKKDENVKNSLIGTTEDNKDSDTIYGVKKYVEERITEEKEQYFKGETVAENFKTQLLSVREITADSDVASGLPILNIGAPQLTITAGAGDNYPGTGVDIQAQNISIQSASDEKPQVVSIKNLTDPTNDYDAVHKKYVDKQIEAVIGEAENPSTYNTIYGVKKYVDEQVAKIPDDVITEDKLAEKGYLVTIPDEYITETELSEYISPDGDINTDWESIRDKPSIYPTNWENVEDKPSIYPTNWENVEDKPTNLVTTNNLNDYLKISTDNWSFENSTVNIAPFDQVKISTNNDNADGISINSANVLSLSGKSSVSISTDENCLMQFQNYSISLNSSQGISLSGGSAISLSSPKIILNGNEELHLQIKSNNLISLSPKGVNLGGFFDGGQIDLNGSITFAKSPLGGQGSIFYLYSPDGNKWAISIDNDGDITTNKITT